MPTRRSRRGRGCAPQRGRGGRPPSAGGPAPAGDRRGIFRLSLYPPPPPSTPPFHPPCHRPSPKYNVTFPPSWPPSGVFNFVFRGGGSLKMPHQSPASRRSRLLTAVGAGQSILALRTINVGRNPIFFFFPFYVYCAVIKGSAIDSSERRRRGVR